MSLRSKAVFRSGKHVRSTRQLCFSTLRASSSIFCSITATDEGLFIKSDARSFALPGRGQSAHSRLFHFRWDCLDAAWFVGDDKDNVALTVDPACSERFVSVCKGPSAAQPNPGEIGLTEVDAAAYPERNQKAAVVQAANALNAEEAVLAERKAYGPDYQAGHGEMADKANRMIDEALGHSTENTESLMTPVPVASSAEVAPPASPVSPFSPCSP